MKTRRALRAQTSIKALPNLLFKFLLKMWKLPHLALLICEKKVNMWIYIDTKNVPDPPCAMTNILWKCHSKLLTSDTRT